MNINLAGFSRLIKGQGVIGGNGPALSRAGWPGRAEVEFETGRLSFRVNHRNRKGPFVAGQCGRNVQRFSLVFYQDRDGSEMVTVEHQGQAGRVEVSVGLGG